MKQVGVLVVSVAVLWVGAFDASAAILCQKKSGAVVVRAPDCKKKEVRLDPAALGLQASGGYMVVDSAGREVGPVVDAVAGYILDGSSALAVGYGNAGGSLLILGVSRASLVATGLPEFVYASSDCSGTPYLRDEVNLTRPISTFDPDTGAAGPTGYYAGTPIQQVTRRSWARSDPDGSSCIDCNVNQGVGASVASRIPEDASPWCCCSLSPEKVSGYIYDVGAGPLTTVDLSGFVPPFHVQ